MECLIARCQEQTLSVDGDRADAENRGWPVHIEGVNMHGAAELKDGQFDVKFDSGCVRLRSEVQVFQRIEHQNKQQHGQHHGHHGHRGGRGGHGGHHQAQPRVTQEWSATWHPTSANLHGQCGPNTKPDGLALGSFSSNCSKVEFGKGFILTDSLVSQINDFKPVVGSDMVTLFKPGASSQKEEAFRPKDQKYAGAKDAYSKPGPYGKQQPGYGKKPQGGFDPVLGGGRSRSPDAPRLSGASSGFRPLPFNRGDDGWYYYRPSVAAWR